MTPRVSIVVPNYNYGHFIGHTIESVLRQTFADWELIVVDDNSSDNSREVVRGYIERFPERRISLVHNEQGPSGTPCPINIGIQRMHGEFFAWLSSDDVFAPAKLEEQVRAFDLRPERGMVHTSFETIDENGKTNGSFFPPNEFESDCFTALLDGNFINGNTVLVRKAVLDEVGPFIETDKDNPDLWRAAEYYHWLKISARYPVHCLPDILHYSRRHAGNAGYAAATMGAALERALIRRFIRQEKPAVTPSIVLALCGRGLWREAFTAMDKLDFPQREEALNLMQSLEEDQERWDAGHYQGVRRLDNGRIRTAFRVADPLDSRAMLEAVSRLEIPQTRPYRAAALRKLSCLA